MKRLCLIIFAFVAMIGCTVNRVLTEIEITEPVITDSVIIDTLMVKPVVFTEHLEESEITVASPAKWNGKLLILAHGLRPVDSKISSSFSIDDPFYSKLIENGWVIGSTSYRRNGVILNEAIEDIEFLRKYLVERFGAPTETYLLGTSMGASICTLIAEYPDLPYTAVLAIGLPRINFLKDNGLDYTYVPKIPILFISNRSEVKSPTEYFSKSNKAEKKPAFWTIDRDGHCLVNSAEITQAFKALLYYVDINEIELEKDGTIEIKHTESMAEFIDGKAFAEVLAVHPSYGNFNTTFSTSDLDTLGITKNTYFFVGCRDRFFRIYYGTTYSDVAQGFWIAFAGAEGTLRIARNFANAAQSLRCHTGDNIYIKPLPESEKNIQPYIIPGSEVVDLGILAWDQLLERDVLSSIETSEKALQIGPDILWIKMNLAHAYLVANRYDDAVKIYQKNKGKHVFKESFYFEDMVLEDLDKLESAGLNIVHFDKIRAIMKK
jgi:SAM hydroxide adenosyltransferase C-terminal domain